MMMMMEKKRRKTTRKASVEVRVKTLEFTAYVSLVTLLLNASAK